MSVTDVYFYTQYNGKLDTHNFMVVQYRTTADKLLNTETCTYTPTLYMYISRIQNTYTVHLYTCKKYNDSIVSPSKQLAQHQTILLPLIEGGRHLLKKWFHLQIKVFIGDIQGLYIPFNGCYRGLKI